MKPNEIILWLMSKRNVLQRLDSVEETWQILSITFGLENLCKEPHFIK